MINKFTTWIFFDFQKSLEIRSEPIVSAIQGEFHWLSVLVKISAFEVSSQLP